MTRGPQGVLLGRNVVGGAISIYTARPEQDVGGSFSAEFGNFDSRLFNGHVTGELIDGLSGRLSFQSRTRDGYNRDLVSNRDLDDLNSFQARAQLLWEPESIPDFSARLSIEYMDDESNGPHKFTVPTDPNAPGPWSIARQQVSDVLGGLDSRESLPSTYTYFGEQFPSTQILRREAIGAVLDLENTIPGFATLKSVTGYRSGEAFYIFDQTGIGPRNGLIDPLANLPNNPFLFSYPVNEDEEISQFSQELRAVSDMPNSPLDWIVGVYYQSDEVDKIDRYIGEMPLGVPNLSGEANWINSGENTNVAVFAQLGYDITETVHVKGGVRWSQDEKKGAVSGISRDAGDVFNPDDTVFLSPLLSEFTDVSYSDTTSEITPQFTVDYQPNDNVLAYFTYSIGYKGGGFEDTPANAEAAQIAYDPETATNLELGVKLDLLDGRARINTAVFRIDYEDLQVTQADDGCLCNLTDNAADAEITGIETEVQVLATDNLLLFGNATLLNTEYTEFTDSNGLDNSGNTLQRTPETQFSVGGELTTDFFSMQDALTTRLSYAYQGELYWQPDNLLTEDAFGLFDARITLAPADSPYTFSIWAKNITDEEYRTNVNSFFGDEIGTLGAPRQFGVAFSTSF